MGTALLLRKAGEGLGIGLLGVWFLLSVLVLLPKVKPYVRALDIFSVVPEWKFFAPNPAQGDYCLLYRDQLMDGTVTPWTEVVLLQRRSFWNLFWNPDKRVSKALFDAVSELSGEATVHPETVVASIPYLTLLNYVSHVERLVHPRHIQFSIVHTFDPLTGREPSLIFSSGLHTL